MDTHQNSLVKFSAKEISNSKIAEHSWDEEHRIQWEKAEIIHKGEK
jgi:hypothetical protein